MTTTTPPTAAEITQAIKNREGLADPRPDPGPPCECFSCDHQCGGTDHPESCGPTANDAEGRPICDACQGMADVWDDHRTGVRATIDQDRIRTRVKFGESCWLEPASARALAARLHRLADLLEAQATA